MYARYMTFFKSSEDKRIEFLLRCYLKVLADKQPEDIAKLITIWEYKTSGGRLFDELSEKPVEQQKIIANEVLGTGTDLFTYDIVSLIAYIVAMESPSQEKLSVDKIRSGTDRLSRLKDKTNKIYSSLH